MIRSRAAEGFAAVAHRIIRAAGNLIARARASRTSAIGSACRLRDVQSLDTAMDGIRAVMDTAGSDRAVPWSGATSTGLAVLFAATYPDRCAGLRWGAEGSSSRASSPPEVGCGVRPACRAEVTREVGQLGAGDPWVHDQHPERPARPPSGSGGSRSGGRRPRPRPASARDAYGRVLTPRLTSSSSSWSNVSGFQFVAPDAMASSSASFDG